MGCRSTAVYSPDPRRADRYDVLFSAYRELHDLFGRGGVPTMKVLASLAKTRRLEEPL
ncbi:MAG: hypothetical protein IKX85_02330 [Clostridia bacterium]|nr:hypothetical protein [Clostridia bacterium]